MITLKEACRYQNFLSTLIGQAEYYLRDANNVTLIVEKHKKSKAHAGGEDVELTNVSTRSLSVPVDMIVSFMLDLYREKWVLTKAIDTAKVKNCREMDNMQAMNKIGHGIIDALKRMVAIKPRVSTKSGSDYCFNAEGNQAKYFYDVEVVSTPDFDKPWVKEKLFALSEELENNSTTIDNMMTTTNVDYNPTVNYNESFEDLLDEYFAAHTPA